MNKYKILIGGITVDGVDLEKDKVHDLPWQLGDSYVARGWAEKANISDATDEKPKVKPKK